MHKQVSGCTVNFGPNFPESPFLELKTRKPPPPPHFGKLQIWDDQSLLRNTPPHFGKLQIWDDQSLLRNTPLPPFRKTSDLGRPKFTPEYPPPPHFGKLQIWDDQSLLRNTPPSRQFKNAESYYMWRLYPTGITTRWICGDYRSNRLSTTPALGFYVISGMLFRPQANNYP